MNLYDYIATIEGFPKEGISFKDITPLLQNGDAFKEAIDKIVEFGKEVGADVVCGPEARGFIFACAAAYGLGVGFVPVRKPGKLPRKAISYEYSLEYGTNTLCMHADAIKPGQKVLIIDDLLATGGTIDATKKLIKDLGGETVGCAFLIELDALKGRELLGDTEVMSILHY